VTGGNWDETFPLVFDELELDGVVDVPPHAVSTKIAKLVNVMDLNCIVFPPEECIETFR
jgi:hypothetical protein